MAGRPDQMGVCKVAWWKWSQMDDSERTQKIKEIEEKSHFPKDSPLHKEFVAVRVQRMDIEEYAKRAAEIPVTETKKEQACEIPKRLWVARPKENYRKAISIVRKFAEFSDYRPPLPKTDFSHEPYELYYHSSVVRELKTALTSCKAAMKYAHEDRSDQYYLNVLSEIEKALEVK